MTEAEKKAFERLKNDKMRTARQLFYGKDTVDAIRKAESESEIYRILRNRRLRED